MAVTYREVRKALEQMKESGIGWAQLESGKVITLRGCKEFIEENNRKSPESNFEQARRDA